MDADDERRRAFNEDAAAEFQNSGFDVEEVPEDAGADVDAGFGSAEDGADDADGGFDE